MTTQSERYKKQADAVVPYAAMDELPSQVLDQIARLRRNLPVVFILYYGGTIGMTKLKAAFDKMVYGPTDDAEKLLEPLTVKGLKDKIQVVWVPVYKKAIDSTNGRWVHWVSIGNAIKLLYDLATGFVVCGGTDTMAHLAAAMRFMFPNIGKPIVATGAQIPMIELGDDATNNLYFAITAAASDISGSFLMFGDELMDGGHVHKVKDKRRKAFACPDQFLFGHYDDELRIYSHAPRRNPIITSARLQFQPHFREGVKVVRISPATPSESILHDATDPTCSAMLLITFGAGNVRDEGVIEDEQSHIDCLWQLHQRRYPVVLGSPMMDGVVDSPYLSGAKAVSKNEGDGNAISAGCTTGAALEVKCMVALAKAWDDNKDALDYDKFRAAMEQNHVGELG
ncbi:MAG: asparaginase domain-containing protein [Patescibacteria group bacterium]|nr:asparaginase domain-containing protein [Patescibacteria group bacterium]